MEITKINNLHDGTKFEVFFTDSEKLEKGFQLVGIMPVFQETEDPQFIEKDNKHFFFYIATPTDSYGSYQLCAGAALTQAEKLQIVEAIEVLIG